MVLFQKLKYLAIFASSAKKYPPYSLCHVASPTCFSSTLTVLCIDLYCIADCLAILDGHLSQLITFIVRIDFITGIPLIYRKMVS